MHTWTHFKYDIKRQKNLINFRFTLHFNRIRQIFWYGENRIECDWPIFDLWKTECYNSSCSRTQYQQIFLSRINDLFTIRIKREFAKIVNNNCT